MKRYLSFLITFWPIVLVIIMAILRDSVPQFGDWIARNNIDKILAVIVFVWILGIGGWLNAHMKADNWKERVLYILVFGGVLFAIIWGIFSGT